MYVYKLDERGTMAAAIQIQSYSDDHTNNIEVGVEENPEDVYGCIDGE